MAADGFYGLDFSALIKGAPGVVVLENGQIRGGDDQYLYSGMISGADDNLRASLKVKAYVPGARSVFGTSGGQFLLELSGKLDSKDIVFSGSSPFPGTPPITIRAKYLAALSLV